MKIDSSFLPTATSQSTGMVKPGPNMVISSDGSIYYNGVNPMSMPYYFETTILSSQQPLTEFILPTPLSEDSHWDLYLGKLMMDRWLYTLGTDFQTITFDTPLDQLGDVELVVSGIRSDYLMNLLEPRIATLNTIGAVKPGSSIKIDPYGTIDISQDISFPIGSTWSIRAKSFELYDELGDPWSITIDSSGSLFVTKIEV